MRPYRNQGYTIETTKIDTWFERDRSFVALYSSRSDVMLMCWWDAAVNEAVEDGFLDMGRLHETALAYYKQHVYPKTEVELHTVDTSCIECGVLFHDLNKHALCDACLVEHINGAGELELDDA